MEKYFAFFVKVFYGIIVAFSYYIYTCSNPGSDGIIFGSTLLLLGLLSGISWNELKHLKEKI